MANNKRPEKWWNSTPKIIRGKFLVVAILPDGEETTSLFTLEELAAHLTPRALDADTWTCKKCTRQSSNFRVNCFWCGHPRQ